MLFRKKKPTLPIRPAYDTESLTPAIRVSICTGEQVAGFVEKGTGRFEDIMLIKSPADLEEFRRRYGIEGEIPKIY